MPEAQHANGRLARTASLAGRIFMMARWAAFATGVLVIVVTFTPLVPWWAHKLSGGFHDPRGNVLIVLGAASSDDGILSYSSYLRSAYAVRAWREKWPATIVISGDAVAIRDFLVAHGVRPDTIRVEEAAKSTRESALFTRSLIQNLPGTKVLLTSDYHIYRAERAFRKVGVQVAPRPFPEAVKRSTSRLGRWPVFLQLCDEMVKIAYYRVRGWM